MILLNSIPKIPHRILLNSYRKLCPEAVFFFACYWRSSTVTILDGWLYALTSAGKATYRIEVYRSQRKAKVVVYQLGAGFFFARAGRLSKTAGPTRWHLFGRQFICVLLSFFVIDFRADGFCFVPAAFFGTSFLLFSAFWLSKYCFMERK